jgi:hypothetical protein
MLSECRSFNFAEKFLLYPFVHDVNPEVIFLPAKPFCERAEQSRLWNNLYVTDPNYTLTCIEYIESHSIIQCLCTYSRVSKL